MTRTLRTTCIAFLIAVVMAAPARIESQALDPSDVFTLFKVSTGFGPSTEASALPISRTLFSDGTLEISPSNPNKMTREDERFWREVVTPEELANYARNAPFRLTEPSLLQSILNQPPDHLLQSTTQSVVGEVKEFNLFDHINEAIVISRADAPRFLPLARDTWTTLRQLIAPTPSARGIRLAVAGRNRAADRRDLWLAPSKSGQQAQPDAKAAAALPRLRMLFVSLGVSTGEAFQAEIVNDGPEPIRIDAMQLVLEPLSAEEARRAASSIKALRAKRPTMARITGYCLDFTKQPPAAGTLYRVAPLKTQQQSDPVRRILHAARVLQATGALRPDSDPTGYFHSVRQWAIWTLERRFTLETFTQAYIEHTKKIFKAGRRPWTAEAEDVLRNAAPGRWRDIEQVLREADRLRTAAE